MCQLPPKQPNIEKKKPNNFLTPSASKKSQICEIWRQKSQSGNPAALNALCPGQDKTKCKHYNTWDRQLQKRRLPLLPLLRRSTVTSQSQLVGHIALASTFVEYCSKKIQKKARFRLAKNKKVRHSRKTGRSNEK